MKQLLKQLSMVEERLMRELVNGAELLPAGPAPLWYYRKGDTARQVRQVQVRKLAQRGFVWPVRNADGVIVKYICDRNFLTAFHSKEQGILA